MKEPMQNQVSYETYFKGKGENTCEQTSSYKEPKWAHTVQKDIKKIK